MDKVRFVLHAAEVHFCIVFLSSTPQTLRSEAPHLLQLYLLQASFSSWLFGAPSSSSGTSTVLWTTPFSRTSFPFVL